MKVRKHFPMDENLARPKGTRPIENVEIEGTLAEGRQLFHDLNRIMSLVDLVAPLHTLVEADGDAYRRLHAFLEALQPHIE